MLTVKRQPWQRRDVHEFLNETFQGTMTLARVVTETRRRFPNQKPKRESAGQTPQGWSEVDSYLDRFVLDVLRISSTNFVDSLLTADTPRGRLGNLTRP